MELIKNKLNRLQSEFKKQNLPQIKKKKIKLNQIGFNIAG